MNNAKFLLSRGMVACLCLVLLAGGATVLATTESGKKLLGFRPDVKILLSANVERDNKLLSLDKKTIVKPGELIQWNLVSENYGNASAEGYRSVANIPNGTSFVAGSAKSDSPAELAYSIDGGNSFSTQPMIEETQVDGSVKKVVAPIEMYTNVLFKWENSLEAGKKLTAKYLVKVK
jgi:uncharacterized repeat protein (TIGR01451 family)